MEAQRIAVIGAGAIGGVLAAAANQAGHQVTLCVRTPFEDLTLETPDSTERVPATIVSEPEQVPEVDWVLLTTKVQDVASASPWLRALDNARTPVVLVQNGVEHRESVAGLGLRAPLLTSLIYVGAERVRPGHVLRRSPSRMVVPEGELGSRFAELFAGSEQKMALTPDFHTEAWRKMLTNLAANPITALTLRRLDVFDEPDPRGLAEDVLTEGLEVARAEGAELTRADVDRLLTSYMGMPADNGTSMLYDRLAGVPTEHEHITGAVVRAAQRHGVKTPLNQAILTLMRALRPSG